MDTFEKYVIPADIKNRIPEHFYYALGGEFVSVFGRDALIPDEDGLSPLDFCTGTAGYVAALKATCQKLDMGWLLDYWNELPYYQSDVFDGEIADEVTERFADQDGAGNNINPYYLYLVSLEAPSPSQS